MFYFKDGPTDKNVFAFYDSLISASLTQFQHEYLRLVAECQVEDNMDDEIFEYFGGHMPSFEEFYGYTSKMQSKALFKELEMLIENQTDEEEKKRFSQTIISKITYYIHKIKRNEKIIEQSTFMNDLEEVKTDIQIRFPEILAEVSNEAIASNPKIKWLGTKNQLATLFWDLWKGQGKRNGETTKPIIDTNKNDLMAFLANNFTDKANQPLKPSTLSDYLNQAKPETRAKEEVRVEIQIPN